MMIHISDKFRYLLYNANTDMRKSLHGLAAIVRYKMQGNVLSGDIYILSASDVMPLSCFGSKQMASLFIINDLKKAPLKYLHMITNQIPL
jgi:hypothetical protein